MTAFPDSGGGEYYVRLDVSGPTSPNHVVIDEWSSWGLGYSIPAVLGWAPDSSQVYIASQVVPDGCAPFPLLSDVRIVAVPYGSPEPINSDWFGPLSLAPDADRMANISEGNLTVHNLSGEEVLLLPLDLSEADRAGSIIWSNDGMDLAWVIQRNACNREVVSEIKAASPTTGAIRNAASLPGSRVTIREWIGENYLLLGDSRGSSLLLELDTGQLAGE